MVFDKLMEYERYICDAVSRFKTAFGDVNLLFLWRSGKIPRTGHLDAEQRIEYSCHGSGCTVDYFGTIVSFDFDSTGQYCYTAFKFALFLDEDSLDNDALSAVFAKMSEQGVLTHIPNYGLRLTRQTPP
ncbi:DUF6896 domain-containing protein [Tuwongella immobilis]|uniref:DUF6896 domain-containing protein n=1 Tax=Tuwongella immobilis TaxID=692036 RepID=A0A6C2YL59_9BACT|nr:hypothetical protein [Tuwongella immobilis]VIP01652.1 unnamed protein product [Tuwongella immobilis]VTR99044.1 unnamed protein product [Tuwongella immobilis]